MNKNDRGIDSDFSLDPHELKDLVIQSKIAHKSIGEIKFGATKSEKKSIKFRRSLFVIKDVKKNDIISKNNIQALRPNIGIEAKHFNKIIGKKFNKNFKKNTILKKSMIKQ